MEEYAFFIEMGFVIALVLLIGLILRVLGFRFRFGAGGKNAKQNKRSKGKGEKEQYFQQAAYVDDGNGNTEWEDGDMYSMKEGKGTKRRPIDMDKVKEDDKYDSWDNY
ncbi:MAG: hypothetical protein ISR45_11030 [Rhodospirillales bacterium]|nr:hypothetical protein [Rhodospirillales bacterium]